MAAHLGNLLLASLFWVALWLPIQKANHIYHTVYQVRIHYYASGSLIHPRVA